MGYFVSEHSIVVPVDEHFKMQTILILLLNTFLLTTANVVSQERIYDSLLDFQAFQQLKQHDLPEYICKDSPVDIVLVIDSSRSINELDFQEQIKFLVEFVTLFDIKPSRVRFAAVSFGQRVITQGAFNFNKYNTTVEVQWGLRRIKYEGVMLGGETNTASALKYVRERYLSRARPDARKLTIVLTDGRSTDPRKTQEEAALIKKEGVTMVAIGIGKRTSMEELKGIASSSDFVFTVDKHSLLETIQKKLILKTCTDIEFTTKEPPFPKDEGKTTERPSSDQTKAPTKTPEPELVTTTTTTKSPSPGENKVTTKRPYPPPGENGTTKKPIPPSGKKKGCNGTLDINFVFNPALIGTKRVITFIENTVTSKALTNDDIRVGIITVPFQDISGFRLKEYKSKKKMRKHFDRFKNNLLAPQLKDLRLQSFLPSNGGRENARQIGVVFLRGRLDDVIQSIVEATLAKASGIEIYVIAVADTDNEVIKDHIATDSAHVLNAPNTNEFLELSEEFMKLIC